MENLLVADLSAQSPRLYHCASPLHYLNIWAFFHEDLVMKLFLRPFFLFRWFKKSSCQLMVKGCALSTGYLPRGGLPRNSVDRITDRPIMTSAVDRGRKASTQTNKQNFSLLSGPSRTPAVSDKYPYGNKRLLAVYCCNQAVMVRLSCCS